MLRRCTRTTRIREARVERVDDSHPSYRRETVSIKTAYGDEKIGSDGFSSGGS